MKSLGALALLLLAPSVYAASLEFTNTSNESIPLEIPGVMNPNLSPNSNSGVTLEPGQRVYFRHRGKRALLLEISDERDGQVIIVNELITKRSRELDALRQR